MPIDYDVVIGSRICQSGSAFLGIVVDCDISLILPHNPRFHIDNVNKSKPLFIIVLRDMHEA